MLTNRLYKTAVYLFTIAMFGVLYIGCGKSDSPTAPGNDDNNPTTPPSNSAVINGPIMLTPGNELIPTFGETDLNGYVRTQYSGTTQYLEAQFLAGNQAMLGGNVTVNGNQLEVDGDEYYSYKIIPGFPNVKFDGTAHNWTISGSANVPAFTTSVNSPTSRPSMITPAFNGSAYKNQPLKVEWSGAGNNDVQVLIYQLAPSYQVTAAVAAMAQGNSYTFTTQQLSIFQPGEITVRVATMSHNLAQAGSKKIMVVSESFHARHISLL